jgi:hypothetical protein
MVSGVRYENSNGASETIAADLVVDASGRGALTLALLRSIGRPLPEETTIGIDLGYATCVFAILDGASTDWKGVMTFGQAPQNSRGGLMLPLEGNRWMVTRRCVCLLSRPALALLPSKSMPRALSLNGFGTMRTSSVSLHRINFRSE